MVEDGGARLVTYSELAARARTQASRLSAMGVRARDIVAVTLPRGSEQIVSMLAVWELGGVYLPIDAAVMPPKRVASLLAHARPRAVVASAVCAPQSGAREGEERPPPGCCYVLFTSGSSGLPKAVVGSEAGLLARCAWARGALRAHRAGARAVVAHRTSLGFVDALAEVVAPLLAGGRVVALPEPTSREPARLLAALRAHRVTLVTVVPSLLTMLLQQLAADAAAGGGFEGSRAHAAGEGACVPSLETVCSSGEALPACTAARFFAPAAAPPSGTRARDPAGGGARRSSCSAPPRLRLAPRACELLNLYGCTEASADACAHRVSATRLSLSRALVPIGRPLGPCARLALRVASSQAAAAPPRATAATAAVAAATEPAGGPAGQSVWRWLALRAAPRGCVGELCIGGKLCALGYLAPVASGSWRDGRAGGSALAGTGGGAPDSRAAAAGAAGSFVRLAERARGVLELAPPGAPASTDYFCTGDLAEVGSDGSLHFLGRLLPTAPAPTPDGRARSSAPPGPRGGHERSAGARRARQPGAEPALGARAPSAPASTDLLVQLNGARCDLGAVESSVREGLRGRAARGPADGTAEGGAAGERAARVVDAAVVACRVVPLGERRLEHTVLCAFLRLGAGAGARAADEAAEGAAGAGAGAAESSVVPVSAQVEAGWRRALAETLPAHELPSRLCALRAWPCTAAGKVDRAALRALASRLLTRTAEQHGAPAAKRARTAAHPPAGMGAGSSMRARGAWSGDARASPQPPGPAMPSPVDASEREAAERCVLELLSELAPGHADAALHAPAGRGEQQQQQQLTLRELGVGSIGAVALAHALRARGWAEPGGAIDPLALADGTAQQIARRLTRVRAHASALGGGLGVQPGPPSAERGGAEPSRSTAAAADVTVAAPAAAEAHGALSPPRPSTPRAGSSRGAEPGEGDSDDGGGSAATSARPPPPPVEPGLSPPAGLRPHGPASPRRAAAVCWRSRANLASSGADDHPAGIAALAGAARVGAAAGTAARPRRLACAWTSCLGKCVDASPLLVEWRAASTAEGADVIALCYIGSHSGEFVALDVCSGARVWARTLPGRIESSAATDARGERVYVGCYDGSVRALCARTGREAWAAHTGAEVKASPCVVSHRGQHPTVWVGSFDRTLTALDAPSGENLLTLQVDAAVYAAAVAAEERGAVYAATLGGLVLALDSHAVRRGGAELWRARVGAPVFASPRLCASLLLVAGVDGVLSALGAHDGVRAWTVSAGAAVFATPLCTHAHAYVATQDGTLRCFGVDGEGAVPRWAVQLGVGGHSAPCTLRGGLLVLGTADGHVVAARCADGTEVARVRLPAGVFSSPVVTCGARIVVGCRDDNVYALDMCG